MAGLIGARRTDVALALFGMLKTTAGTVTYKGAAFENHLVARGDRRRDRLCLRRSPQAGPCDAAADPLEHHACDACRSILSPLGLINTGAESRNRWDYKQKLNIRTPNTDIAVGKLSGGNQQKVMLAKWLNMAPDLLIFDEPTRGIDVGAKAEVHDLIRAFAAAGGTGLVISSDLPEVLALGDRILVMREGRQMAIIDHDRRHPGIRHGACHRTKGRRLMGLISRLSPAALRILALLAVLAIVILFFAAQIEGYLNGRLFNRISSSVAIMALIATGQTLVILTRNIDLSVGSMVGFTAFATGSIITNNPDLNPLLLLLYSAARRHRLRRGQRRFSWPMPACRRSSSPSPPWRCSARFSSNIPTPSPSPPSSLPDVAGRFPQPAGVHHRQRWSSAPAFTASLVVVIVVHLCLTRLRPARATLRRRVQPRSRRYGGHRRQARGLRRLRAVGPAGGPWRASCSSPASATSPWSRAWGSS